MWQYDIAGDSWKRCAALPVDNLEPYGTVLAASENGVYLYASMIKGASDTKPTGSQADNLSTASDTVNELYAYDAAKDSWEKVDVGCKLPDFASVFSHDGDLYFVGGTYNDKSVYLSAYRTKTKQLEVLDAIPGEENSLTIYTPKAVAFDGTYVYVAGVRGTSLMRLRLNGEGKMDKVDNLTESLKGKVNKNGRADALSVPAVAATSTNGFVVGTELNATDTYMLPQTDGTLQGVDYTSSFYKSNAQSAVWHDGMLYVMGYSPSEQSRVFFRAHSWPDAQKGEQMPEQAKTSEGTSQGHEGTDDPGAPAQADQATTTLPETGDTLPAWLPFALVGCGAIAASAMLERKGRRRRASQEV